MACNYYVPPLWLNGLSVRQELCVCISSKEEILWCTIMYGQHFQRVQCSLLWRKRGKRNFLYLVIESVAALWPLMCDCLVAQLVGHNFLKGRRGKLHYRSICFSTMNVLRMNLCCRVAPKQTISLQLVNARKTKQLSERLTSNKNKIFERWRKNMYQKAFLTQDDLYKIICLSI